jgi:GT2 family glycosyltransferase
MAYYNRKPQLIRTLKSIEKSIKVDEVEVIITNDCSAPEHSIDDLNGQFKFPINVINVDPKDRWYINPCVPFNMAIKEAKGEFIILQNPECMHVGDILLDVSYCLNPKLYITYGCYSINQDTTNSLGTLNLESETLYDDTMKLISPLTTASVIVGENSWYNHSLYRPNAYHFISAINKVNITDLGGFDERYAMGIGFDDDELLWRIKLKGLSVLIQDSPMGIHQWHYSENNFFAKAVNPSDALYKNQVLFNNITKKETTWIVNK